MSQYFIDKLVYNNDTLDIHDTEAREMIATNTTNIQAVSARVTQNANDIDDLEEITSDLRVDLDNVEDRVSVTEGEIDGLKTRTTSLEGRMATTENRLDGHDTKISDLEDRMDVAENNITALDGRMTAAERDIETLDGRLDLVEAKNDEQDIAIDDLEENVAQNTADIVDIKDDLTGIHEDIDDLDDRITASTYEAGIGIYFGQGVEHTNINVEDEILDQINQNTIDIQNLKTRVENIDNRLTDAEADIVHINTEIIAIKSDILEVKTDIASLYTRVAAVEGKVLPAGGTAGQMLVKSSNANYDVEWVDTPNVKQRRWTSENISEYTAPDANGVWTDYFDKSCFTVAGAHLNVVPFCNTESADKNLNWVVRTNYMSNAGWDKTAYGFGGNVSSATSTTGVETAIMFSSRELVTTSYTQWNYVSGGIMIGVLSAVNKNITKFDTHDFIKTILAPDTSAGRYSNISKPGSILKLYYYITVSGMLAYELGEILVTAFGVNADKLIGNTTTVDYDNNAYFVKLSMEYANDAVTNTITTVNLGALT